MTAPLPGGEGGGDFRGLFGTTGRLTDDGMINADANEKEWIVVRSRNGHVVVRGPKSL